MRVQWQRIVRTAASPFLVRTLSDSTTPTSSLSPAKLASPSGLPGAPSAPSACKAARTLGVAIRRMPFRKRPSNGGARLARAPCPVPEPVSARRKGRQRLFSSGAASLLSHDHNAKFVERDKPRCFATLFRLPGPRPFVSHSQLLFCRRRVSLARPSLPNINYSRWTREYWRRKSFEKWTRPRFERSRCSRGRGAAPLIEALLLQA